MTQRRRDPHSAAQRARRQQRVNQKVDTAMQSPCGAKPKTIASGDVTLTFLETDKQKGSKYRLRVTWPEVTEDTDGFPVSTIQQYVVHLQHSDDGSTWDSDFRRKVVDVKDGDDNTTAKAIFKNITRKRYYRVRVRAKDSKGCKSDLPASWSASARAGGSDTVPSVGTIRRTRVGPRRIEFDWDDVEHPNFDRYKVVILKADTENGGFDTVRTRYVRQSMIAVHVGDDDKTKWWKVRVRVMLDKNPDGTTDEGSDTDSTADQANDLPFPNDSEIPRLQLPQNAVSAFNQSTRAHTVSWTSPDNITGYQHTRILGYGCNDPVAGDWVQLWAANYTSTATNTSQTYQRIWNTGWVGSYAYARLTLQHIADTSGVKRDGPVWTSDKHATGGGTAAGTAVAEPTAVAVTWNADGDNGVKATWTNPSPTTNIAYVELQFQGKRSGSGDFEDLGASITRNLTQPRNYTYLTTATDRLTYRYYRVRIRSISSNPTVADDSAWVGATQVDSGLGAGTPPPALALPTVTIPSRTAAPITGGIRFKIRLTGTSGTPNGSATQIQWVLRRSQNSNAVWTDRPFDDAAPGNVHDQGIIPVVPRTSGTSIDYSGAVDYFRDQNSSQQLYFQLYAKAQDTTQDVSTEWVKSTQFTIAAPSAPGAIDTGQSAVFVGANGYPYFVLYFTPSASDGGTPGDASLGENDVAYWINWQISTSISAPTSGWNEIFKRTSSSLGDGVTWDGTQYRMRIPADGRLNQVIPGPASYMWVKVRCQYIGDGGDDLEGGANMRGNYSGFNTAVKMPRGN